MTASALTSGAWKEFLNGFKHAEIFIANDQTYISRLAFF